MAGSSKGGPAEKDQSQKHSLVKDIGDADSPQAVFQRISVVTADLAQHIFQSGIESLEALAEVKTDELVEVDGLDESKVEKIKEEAKELLESKEEEKEEDEEKQEEAEEKETSSQEDDSFSEWLTGERDDDLNNLLDDEIRKAKKEKTEAKKRQKEAQKASKQEKKEKEQAEVDREDHEALESWLSGEDESFDSWLGEESFEEEKEEMEEELEEKEEKIEEKKKDLESRKGELESIKENLKEKLKGAEEGTTEIEDIIEENTTLKSEISELQENINELRQEKEEIEEEIEQIKQGSVAMLKYLKKQKKESTGGVEQRVEQVTEVSDEEAQEKIEELKEESRELQSELETVKSSKDYKELSDSEIGEELKEKEKEIDRYKRELSEKDDNIQDLQDDLKMKKSELSDLKEKLEYKEQELSKREEDLQHREQVISKQKKELEAKKQQLGDMTEQERQRRLEELKKEIEQKEQELKSKEEYIEQKEKELRAREEDLIDEELEEREEEVLQEIEQEKAKTGTGRLDDLLLGGIPLSSNVSIYGPPHLGKEVMMNSFVAEGVEKGVPAIWVVTDKTIDDIREEMKFILPTYEDYERRDLIYYVDAYSVSMGKVKEEEKDKEHIKYVDEQSDVSGITQAVDDLAEKIKEKHRYYRLSFQSVSTIIAYLDTETTFRKLQPFAGRRKRDKAVALYSLEKGMHSEQDISMLGHMMNGEIEFKSEQLETYLRVQGLGDVQTRDWVEYTSSKSGITMGSFSLDTIR